MFRPRNLALGVLVVLFGFGLWASGNLRRTTLSAAQAEASEGDCSDCRECRAGKTRLPEDPQQRAALFQEFQQQESARNALRADEARARANEWKGSRFVPRAPQASGDEYSQQAEAASVMAECQTVPESRMAFFKAILADERFHHIGWEGVVEKVTDASDGRCIELHVRPLLAKDTGSPTHTPRTFRETWKIDKSGQLSLVKGEDGGGLGVIIVD